MLFIETDYFPLLTIEKLRHFINNSKKKHLKENQIQLN